MMEAKSVEAGNPNLILGGAEASYGSGGGGAQYCGGDHLVPLLNPEAMMKNLFPDYNYEEDLHNGSFQQARRDALYYTLETVMQAYEQKKRLNKLIGEHDALKTSYEQLRSASDADKEKLMDLEKQLEDLRAQIAEDKNVKEKQLGDSSK